MDDETSLASRPFPRIGNTPTPRNPHSPKSKPDARPMRLAMGAAGLAAFSALAAAIVLPPRPVALPPAGAGNAVSGPAGSSNPVQRPVQYVQLQPGQTAPPGAKVIDPAAPKPVTIVTTVAAPPQKPITIKTTQSGKVIP
jgi:hypothetical protein